MSPMISTLALRASAAVQCGAGWVSGTPGASTSAATADQSSARRSCVLMPAACASASFFASSSKAITSAPPAAKRARRQQTRTAEAENRDFLARERGDRDHFKSVVPAEPTGPREARPMINYARAGTHTPQSIDSARRMGPRLRGDDNPDHRNFSVARPASASTTATIQNRITICGSVQPSCS